MRILAFSDVRKWHGYERLVDRCRPEVVALAGDLISDGGAAFWLEALQLLPQFRQDREDLRERCKRDTRRSRGCSICRDPVLPYERCELKLHTDVAFFDHVRQLQRHYQKTEAFASVHRKIHTDRFYRFLKYAGRRACVLLIKGDHDNDFPGDYDPRHINGIPGCHEISGQTFEAKGVFFLGVSYQETAYRCVARALLARFPQRGGIVISHARQRNVRLLAELRPRLIIRGHYGFGKFLLDGIPAVFTAGGPPIINASNARLPHIRLLSDRKGKGTIALTPEKASFEDLLQEDYPWLAPYPVSPVSRPDARTNRGEVFWGCPTCRVYTWVFSSTCDQSNRARALTIVLAPLEGRPYPSCKSFPNL